MPSRPRTPPARTGAARVTVLGALAIASVVLPLSSARVAAAASDAAAGPTSIGPISTGPISTGPTSIGVTDDDWASQVLERADTTLAAGTGAAGPDREDATLLLRDLYAARPSLSVIDDLRAESILARPTDGRRDPYGDGYRTPAARTCGPDVCVHAVRRGADAPPDRSWVRRVLREMQRVWRVEIGRLGYRPPPSDGEKGGDGRFDVYLRDLGAQGLFGYCAPERRTAPGRETASSYCVLDDDFARSQYDEAPLDSLRVTAAHEFFHAVQFGYDVTEDPWVLESTAMWMEERVAGDVNDNRAYLRYGQLRHPERSLDLFDTDGYDQYGNWIFWEFLSERYGVTLVRDLWDELAATPGAPNRTSIGGLRAVLADRGGLPAVFARFSAGLVHPAATFREGSAWPAAGPSRRTRLTPASRKVRLAVRLDHLTSHSLDVVPDDALPDDSRVVVSVSGPRAVTSPVAVAVVRTRDGARRTRTIRLDSAGRGQATLPFGPDDVASVVVTLANASTRYDCDAGNPSYACRGVPLDDVERFRASVRLVR